MPPEMKREIPIIDLRCLSFHLSAKDETFIEKGKEFVNALSKIGFAYLINHGVPESEVNSAIKAGRRFFDLDSETKNKYKRDPQTYQGYAGINQENVDLDHSTYEPRESFTINSGPEMFPDEVEDFKPAFKATCQRFLDLSHQLLKLLAAGFGLEEKCVIDKHTLGSPEVNISTQKILQYPPVPSDIPKNAIRCGAHTDYGTFTLLFQDDVGGLEVLNAQGEWIPVDPIPGSCLLNVGDFLEIMTEKKLTAVKHRIPINFDGREKLRRNSLVFFVVPNNDVKACPLGKDNSNAMTAQECLRAKYYSTNAA